MNAGHLATLLRLADRRLQRKKGLNLILRRPLRRRARAGTRRLLGCIESQLSMPGAAAIMAARDPWPHWTVATKVTPSRLHLLDSGGDLSVATSRGDPARPRLYHVGLVDPSRLFAVTLRSRW